MRYFKWTSFLVARSGERIEKVISLFLTKNKPYQKNTFFSGTIACLSGLILGSMGILLFNNSIFSARKSLLPFFSRRAVGSCVYVHRKRSWIPNILEKLRACIKRERGMVLGHSRIYHIPSSSFVFLLLLLLLFLFYVFGWEVGVVRVRHPRSVFARGF